MPQPTHAMRRTVATLVVALALVLPATLAGQTEFLTTRFERYLDALRRQAGIPGLSAAIVLDDRIIWERGFGQQNVEAALPATPDTPYFIADLTQTFSATLVLQCVQQGTLQLTDVVRLTNEDGTFTPVTVEQLLAHVAAGPEPSFRYDPVRFTAVTGVVEGCWDDKYRERFARSFTDGLAMTRSVPGLDVLDPEQSIDFEQEQLRAYESVLQQMARPYRVDRRGRAFPSGLPARSLDASLGLVSTVRDLALFNAALDTQVLLTASTLADAWGFPPVAAPPAAEAPSLPLAEALPPAPLMAPVPFSPARSPFGLGWFVQEHNGEPVVWHFGYVPDAGSALMLKLPNRRLTLIMLANSDGLSAPYSLAAGDVTTSPFARLFLSLFG